MRDGSVKFLLLFAVILLFGAIMLIVIGLINV